MTLQSIREKSWRLFLQVTRTAVWSVDEWLQRQEVLLRQPAAIAQFQKEVNPIASGVREQNRTNGSGLQVQASGRKESSESPYGKYQQDVDFERHEFSSLGRNFGEWSTLRGSSESAGIRHPRKSAQVDQGIVGNESRVFHHGRRAGAHGAGTRATRSPRRRVSAADFDRVLLDRVIAARASKGQIE